MIAVYESVRCQWSGRAERSLFVVVFQSGGVSTADVSTAAAAAASAARLPSSSGLPATDVRGAAVSVSSSNIDDAAGRLAPGARRRR